MKLMKEIITVSLRRSCTYKILCAAILVIAISFTAKSQELYKEKFRPSYHYTTAKNWINDPNGLVYFEGEYHLFYQYNPFGNVWGHMSWGHAISTDLIHWKELPVALQEEGEVMIFSGSAVIDEKNTAGFATKKGEVPMVAIYTGHIEGKNQSQHLAYSIDKGRTWTKYKGNPVLDLGKKDFRDPKVFWYAPEKKWVMAVVLPIEKQVQFYSSGNLKDWILMSSFGPAGDITGIWECPDLFRIPIIGSPGKYKWVLMHSPAPYMQYFVGEFDGKSFINENPSGIIYRPDYGPDYYAAIVYNNLPEKQLPVSIGWLNNWNYAGEIPVSPWKGAMSLPREMQVKKSGNELILVQRPVAAFNQLLTGEKSWSKVNTHEKWSQAMPGGSFVAEITLARNQHNSLTVDIGNALTLTYIDTASSVLLKRGGNNSFQHPEFLKLSDFSAPVSRSGEVLKIKIFFDQSLAEIFVNDGEVAMTAQVFPEKEGTAITLSSSNGAVIPSIKVWHVNPIWPGKKQVSK